VSPRGRLIALEGGEGSGKSTQAARLAAELDALLTREPGGTELGDRIRSLLLEGEPIGIGPEAELLLMAAARAEHVCEVIAPVLSAGRDVVTDRFSGSSLAYQGYGRGIDPAVVADVSDVATGGLTPDLNIFLDVPDEVARARTAGGDRDRIERAGEAFHVRVAQGFRAIAAADPEHWVTVDGDGSVDEVAARVLAGVRGRLPLPLGG
jgi:dTMP kinase